MAPPSRRYGLAETGANVRSGAWKLSLAPEFSQPPLQGGHAIIHLFREARGACPDALRPRRSSHHRRWTTVTIRAAKLQTVLALGHVSHPSFVRIACSEPFRPRASEGPSDVAARLGGRRHAVPSWERRRPRCPAGRVEGATRTRRAGAGSPTAWASGAPPVARPGFRGTSSPSRAASLFTAQPEARVYSVSSQLPPIGSKRAGSARKDPITRLTRATGSHTPGVLLRPRRGSPRSRARLG